MCAWLKQHHFCGTDILELQKLKLHGPMTAIQGHSYLEDTIPSL